MEKYVIYSSEEMEEHWGFFNSEKKGWGGLAYATRFTKDEIDQMVKGEVPIPGAESNPFFVSENEALAVIYEKNLLNKDEVSPLGVLCKQTVGEIEHSKEVILDFESFMQEQGLVGHFSDIHGFNREKNNFSEPVAYAYECGTMSDFFGAYSKGVEMGIRKALEKLPEIAAKLEALKESEKAESLKKPETPSGASAHQELGLKAG